MTTSIAHVSKVSLSDIQLRENFRTGKVELRIRGEVAFSSSEYRTTATHAQRTYGLSDGDLMELYRDYKDDYDCA